MKYGLRVPTGSMNFNFRPIHLTETSIASLSSFLSCVKIQSRGESHCFMMCLLILSPDREIPGESPLEDLTRHNDKSSTEREVTY